MLLSASISHLAPVVARLFGVLHRVLHDLAIGLHPLRLLDELDALDLEDLHPAAAFMLGGRDRRRRRQSAPIELLDALEARHDSLAFWRFTAGLLQRALLPRDLARRRHERPVITH